MTNSVSGAGAPPVKPSNFITIDQRTLARVVGMVALMLPTVMIVAAFNPWLDTCYRASISHYYYAPFMGSFFIGALVFIGAYLLVYRGDKRPKLERYLSSAAGIFAIGVALFPTYSDGCADPLFVARAFAMFKTVEGQQTATLLQTAPEFGHFQMTVWPVFGWKISSASIHYACAALLFVFLAWFALWVFPTVAAEQRLEGGQLKQNKYIRNVVYYLSGGVIVLCIALMGVNALFGLWGEDSKGTFWAEAVALWAFGASWMVKARVFGNSLND